MMTTGRRNNVSLPSCSEPIFMPRRHHHISRTVYKRGSPACVRFFMSFHRSKSFFIYDEIYHVCDVEAAALWMLGAGVLEFWMLGAGVELAGSVVAAYQLYRERGDFVISRVVSRASLRARETVWMRTQFSYLWS